MDRGGKGRRFWLLLAACALAVAAVRLTARGLPPWAVPVSGAAQRVLAPLERGASAAAGALREVPASLAELANLRRENAELRKRAERAALLEAQLEELRQENARLRQLLDLGKQGAWPGGGSWVATRVIARNPDGWFATAVLGKGVRAGIRPGMAVVTPRGLVGRVLRASPDTATVLLLTDPQSGVGARVQRESSRAEGVVLGQAGRGDALLMRFFDRDADVRRGDRVVTSGLSGELPAGLPIGVVTDVFDERQGPVRYAWIRPAVGFDHLDEVMVLVPPAPAAGGR